MDIWLLNCRNAKGGVHNCPWR